MRCACSVKRLKTPTTTERRVAADLSHYDVECAPEVDWGMPRLGQLTVDRLKLRVFPDRVEVWVFLRPFR